jgi:arylsulfatase A-like enzyme
VGCALLMVGCGPDPLVRPDLVLVTTGAFPTQEAVCHGGAEDVGEELCAIGDEGTRYVWAFAAADAPAPAIASILTGLAPDVHGIDASAASFLRSDVSTVAERLQSAGYATAAFVTHAGLNRSRHFDQGFETFDDGAAAGPRGAEAAPDAAGRAAQWLSKVESPFFAWVHLDPRRAAARAGDGADTPWQPLKVLDRSLSRLLAVVEARPSAPAILVTSLPGAPAPSTSPYERLAPQATRVALLWRPSRFGSTQGVARVIRTPVSQMDVAPTLLRAGGLVDDAELLPGEPLPFRERRPDEPARAVEIQAGPLRARVADGEYVVEDEAGAEVARAPIPLTGESPPRLQID